MSYVFQPGQKVECIIGGDVNPLKLLASSWMGDAPVKGDVYTVLAVEFCELYQKPVLRLHEIANQNGYWVGRFRPIVENKTDIGFAYEILNTTSKREPMPA